MIKLSFSHKVFSTPSFVLFPLLLAFSPFVCAFPFFSLLIRASYFMTFIGVIMLPSMSASLIFVRRSQIIFMTVAQAKVSIFENYYS
jgi:hypothetical protein